MSLAVAPGSTNEVWYVWLIDELPLSEIIGAVVSTTWTVLSTGSAEFPELSETEYVNK